MRSVTCNESNPRYIDTNQFFLSNSTFVRNLDSSPAEQQGAPMKNRLRLTVAMVTLCGFLPTSATFAALDIETIDTSAGAGGIQRATEGVPTVTFDTDGHIDVPRDSNGHILIKTTFGRHGRRSAASLHGGPVCGADQAKSRFRETVTEAVVNAR
jgi:hypothetical protein